MMNRHVNPRLAGLLTPRAFSAAILGFGYAATLALNLPGQLSYDSIAQLHDGRTGIYNAWHPPVMAWMLGVGDAILPGTALFVVFTATLLFGSILSLLWIGGKPARASVAIAAVCIALPQFLIYQGTVWKDVLFADAAIAGFVLIAHAGERWNIVRARNALLAGGTACLVLATLARQNGAIVLIAGLLAIGLIAGAKARAGRIRSGLAYALLATLAALVLYAAASWMLASRTPGESGSTAQFKLLQDYDLVGAVKEDPQLKLDILARDNPDLEEAIRTDGVPLYTPQRNDTLVGAPDLQNELADTPGPVLFKQWRELIFTHPLLYLKIRARVFGWTFFTPDLARCYPFFIGVQGLPAYMHELNLAPRDRVQDNILKTYGGWFADTPVFSHVSFALLATLLAFVLLRRRASTADLVMAALLVSAFVFTLSFFVISIACDYRYLVFLDLAAAAGAFYWAASRQKSARM